MKLKTASDRGEVIDTILSNTIYSKTTTTNQMYIVGEDEAFVTVQCDPNGNVLSAYCKKGYKLLVFTNPEDALFVSNACKQRVAAQIREQQKIESFTKRFK